MSFVTDAETRLDGNSNSALAVALRNEVVRFSSPFVSKWVNWAEGSSLLLLLSVTMLAMEPNERDARVVENCH
jgi:hypothetical protein